jgi:hypothetical protein
VCLLEDVTAGSGLEGKCRVKHVPEGVGRAFCGAIKEFAGNLDIGEQWSRKVA